MERQVTLARGKPEVDDWITHLQALVLARAGRLEAARQSARRATELAAAAGQGERAAVREPPWPCGKGYTATPSPPGRQRCRSSRSRKDDT